MADSLLWSSEKLKAAPVKNGFRQRGTEMNRLETFTDAAFAFAVTLLVIGGGDSIPSNFEEMRQALAQVPAFAASFANIMLFWYAHHIWSRRFGLEDTASVLLSLLLIFLVLIYVYPLKAVYSGAFNFFSNGYLESYFTISSVQDLRTLFVIFGVAFISLSGVIVLINRHALSIKEQLALSQFEIFDTRSEIGSWAAMAGVAMISVLLAVFLPGNLVFLAGVFYCVLSVVMPWHTFRRVGLRKRIDVAPTATSP